MLLQLLCLFLVARIQQAKAARLTAERKPMDLCMPANAERPGIWQRSPTWMHEDTWAEDCDIRPNYVDTLTVNAKGVHHINVKMLLKDTG